MSNTQVGNVYQQIIADVVDSSRVDFEEGGVDEAVLEELRQVWQQKLTSLNVAQFPWDPKQEPVVNPPTVPSNYQQRPQMPGMNGGYGNEPAPYDPRGQYNMPGSMPGSMPGHFPNPFDPAAKPQPFIKPEPGLEGNAILAPPLPQNATAEQRAMANIQAQYGPQATNAINGIQGNAGAQQKPIQMTPQQQQQQAMYHQQQMQQMHRQMPPQMNHMQNPMQNPLQRPAQPNQQPGQAPQQRSTMSQEEYQKAMARNAADQQARLRAQHNLSSAQTDGAGDDMGESVGVIQRDGEIMGRIEIDGLIRDKIAAMGQSMEGGGLMLPLHQASSSKKRERKAKKSHVSGQVDGPDSDDENKTGVKDEELDEDAINSDLDDPDDGLNEEEDDEDGLGHIMLCMYDKVQRVKNKWKCVMKDGVLTVNGKEYVFHKASGEYEW